jgi:hypothetical protein
MVGSSIRPAPACCVDKDDEDESIRIPKVFQDHLSMSNIYHKQCHISGKEAQKQIVCKKYTGTILLQDLQQLQDALSKQEAAAQGDEELSTNTGQIDKLTHTIAKSYICAFWQLCHAIA